MKSTVLIIAIVFSSCVLFEAKCDSNYEHEKQLRKRGADEKANDSSKEMFMKRDKRHAEEHEKTTKSVKEEEEVDEETRTKRDAADQVKEGFQNLKNKAKEGINKMKGMFEANVPRTKRQAISMMGEEAKEGTDKFEDKKSGLDRKKRDASSLIASSIQESPRGKRLVLYDVKESYETRYLYE
jgi:hypothetical protein